MKNVLKRFNSYQIAVFLSSSSMAVGLLRELIIVGLLGFTVKNDLLQIYLSVIYTISLMIDAMRLSCLNLFSVLSLPRILLSASLISAPAAILVGVMMYYSAGGMNVGILMVAVLGGYAHLIACLLITYKQRHDVFLAAQVINVLPNAILIPGIVVCWAFSAGNMIHNIVILTASVPVIQCIALLLLPSRSDEKLDPKGISLIASLLVFARHFSTTIGEQLFQIIARAAFFNDGPGYLSVFSVSVRAYSAMRFILIDSYIGSRLSDWKKELKRGDLILYRIISSNTLSLLPALISLLIMVHTHSSLIQYAAQVFMILIFGFYFSTLVRIIYFKMNHLGSNPSLIMTFALYELVFALLAFIITKQMSHSVIALLWIGYIAKPFSQLWMLRRRYQQILMT